MWELNRHNARSYLLEKGWIENDSASIEELAGGVSNVVLGVDAGGRCFVVKQSRPQLRTREAWFSDVERIYRELEVMEQLQPLLPEGVVPRILHVDRDNFVFAMERAPVEAEVWKQQLLNGKVDVETARGAGRILGAIHEVTSRRADFRERFTDRNVFVQLRVEPFYHRIQERHPDLAEPIQPLVEQMREANEALCHGDFSPKNLLVTHDRIVLVDYETAHFGEPAMDLGFFFSHLMLKGIRSGDWSLYRSLILSAWSGYEEKIRFTPSFALLQRGLKHLGVCILARIDGTSPVDYLPKEDKRSLARHLGRSLLLDPASDWDQVFSRLSPRCDSGGTERGGDDSALIS